MRKLNVAGTSFEWKPGRRFAEIKGPDGTTYRPLLSDVKGMTEEAFAAARAEKSAAGAVTPRDVVNWVRVNVLKIPSLDAFKAGPQSVPVEAKPFPPSTVHLLIASRPDFETIDGMQRVVLGIYSEPGAAIELRTELEKRSLAAAKVEAAEIDAQRRARYTLAGKEERRDLRYTMPGDGIANQNRWRFICEEVPLNTLRLDLFDKRDWSDGEWLPAALVEIAAAKQAA